MTSGKWHHVTETVSRHEIGITLWNRLHVTESASRHGIGITSRKWHHVTELASRHGNGITSRNQLHVTESASRHGIGFTSRDRLHITELASQHGMASRHGKRSCILLIGYQTTDSDCNHLDSPKTKLCDSTPKTKTYKPLL